jgi:hypothetical protein
MPGPLALQVVRPIECDNRDELEGSLDVLDAGDPFAPLVMKDKPTKALVCALWVR